MVEVLQPTIFREPVEEVPEGEEPAEIEGEEAEPAEEGAAEAAPEGGEAQSSQ